MEKRLIKIVMNARYGIHKLNGRGINNYRKLHCLPLYRKKNKKKRHYSRYPKYESYTTLLQILELNQELEDRDAIEEIFKDN